MITPIAIRPANINDMDHIQTIYHNAFQLRPELMSKTNFFPRINKEHFDRLGKRMNESHFHVLIAEHTQPVGYMAYKITSPYSHIEQFYTVPSPHKYGRQLIDAFYQVALESGVKHVELTTTAFGMPRYLHWGFEEYYENSPCLYKYIGP